MASTSNVRRLRELLSHGLCALCYLLLSRLPLESSDLRELCSHAADWVDEQRMFGSGGSQSMQLSYRVYGHRT